MVVTQAKKRLRGVRPPAWLYGLLLAACVGSMSSVVAAQEDCQGRFFDSTYDLIQEVVFENRGCTNDSCHGSSLAGGLDLRAASSYRNLIDVASQTVPSTVVPGMRRVVPGQKDQSLLFLNLAAATLPEIWSAPLRPMPIGLPAVSLEELEAVREWIEQGAPRRGTVPGIGDLLDACLPPPRPIDIEPLSPPPRGEGVQIGMPLRILPGNSESEVCFVSYYDVSGEVPASALSPDGKSFRYKRVQVRQDPLSHHLFVDHYDGEAPLDDEAWGAFKCRDGAKHGVSCRPSDLGFCGEGLCGSEPIDAINCLGFGPPDVFYSRSRLLFSQEASTSETFPPGVFREMPLRGLLIWNSHAFNLTDLAGKLQAWVNVEFALTAEHSKQALSLYDDSRNFSMEVPAFGAQEICAFHVFPPDTRLFELSSHTHRRGKRFRIYAGRFACAGGLREGEPCSPEGSGYEGVDSCDGAPCVSPVPPDAGDCNGDGRIGVNDLTAIVAIALGRFSLDRCPAGDPNQDGRIRVSELVEMVKSSLLPAALVDPSDALIYTSLVYSDPFVAGFEPPLELPGLSASAAARTVTYCSLYDNGFTDPAEVKLQSSSPAVPSGGTLFPDGTPGGPCEVATGCTEGLVGAVCTGGSPSERDASCDSFVGSGDGVCDACPLVGGVTTEDEMFILVGSFFTEGP